MANNENVNKVSYNNSVLIDLTEDTITPEVVVSGYTAHDRSGAPISGTFVPVTGVKGSSESSYRTGNVNLTPADIGALPSSTSIPSKTSDLENDSGFLTSHQDISGKKNTQSAVSDPTASGTSLSFIDSITQNTQGVISPTKKTVAEATTSAAGLMSATDKTKLDEAASYKVIGPQSVISVSDAVVAKAGKVITNIEPVQDLHGYESPWIGTDVDKVPYLFRKISDSSVQDKGTHEFDKLVGGTMAWNQLAPRIDTTNFKVVNGSATISDNLITVNGNAIVDEHQPLNSIANHVYVVTFESINSIVGTARAVVYIFGTTINMTIPTSNSYSRISTVRKASVGKTDTINFVVTDYESGELNIRNFMLIDLTQMFGSTIADYIYSLEQSTSGSGIAWLKSMGFFQKDYYPYNAGELISVKTSAHVMRGFNQWDEEWESGAIDGTDGSKVPASDRIRSANMIPVLPNKKYWLCALSTLRVRTYNADKSYYGVLSNASNIELTIPNDVHYIMFDIANITYNHDICINLSDPAKNGTYEPYEGHTYSLDSDLTLRGIPKLDANNKLYYDGDTYEADGTVTKKYGIVDLGTLNWDYNTTAVSNTPVFFAEINGRLLGSSAMICSKYILGGLTRDSLVNIDKAFASWNHTNSSAIAVRDTAYTDAATFKTAMSGVYLVYELATPTTETADSFTSTQVIDTSGTEEYVDTRTVPIPVGHESNYANICPISGWTGANVTRTGKNLLNIDAAGTITTPDNIQRNGLYIKVNGGGAYYTISRSGGTAVYFFFKSQNGNWTASGMSGTERNKTFQSYGDMLCVHAGGGGILATTTDLQIENGTTATTYEPFGETIPISWQSEAGTVYGGTLDVTTGVLTVTMAEVDLGTLSWDTSWYTESENYRIYTSLSGKANGLSNMICDKYPNANTQDGNMPNMTITGNAINKRLYIRDSSYSSSGAQSLINSLSGVQLVYELATPQTYQLTPVEIEMLLGDNNVWADTGDITVGYLREDSLGTGEAIADAIKNSDVSHGQMVKVAMTKTFNDAIEVTTPTFSTLPKTFSAAGITPEHELVQDGIAYLSNSSAQGSDWTITTGNDEFTISGTCNDSTYAKLSFCVKQKTTATA